MSKLIVVIDDGQSRLRTNHLMFANPGYQVNLGLQVQTIPMIVNLGASSQAVAELKQSLLVKGNKMIIKPSNLQDLISNVKALLN